MQRRRWFAHLVIRALAYRKGRTILLLAVLAMASSIATALGVVSVSMEKRVAEEIRKYGANLVIIPEASRLEVGSGALNFGIVSEPAFLSGRAVEDAIARSTVQADRSLHLRVSLLLRGAETLVEGVDFADIRRLLPWWQLKGGWPGAGEVVAGIDVATRNGFKVGDMIELSDNGRSGRFTISGIVTTGGEEDSLLFVPLQELQGGFGLEDRVTMVRLLVSGGGESVRSASARLQPLIAGSAVREVRQVARTSEGLLAKVQLLMVLVTAVVVICAGSSVAGTMSTTVLERGREIGLMKAMGGTRREVLLIFSGEALLIGLLGGVAGCVLGNMVAWFVTKSVFDASAEAVPWIPFISVGVSLVLAFVGSVGPLVSVFRLDPARSLRGE